jgi:hypothetical protein
VTTSQAGGRLSLADGWREAAFDRGAYGPDDRAGLTATLEHETEDVSLRVVPVRYACTDGRERLDSLTDDLSMEWREAASFTADVTERTAFATVVETRYLRPEHWSVATVARDAGDALAVAVWLADGAETPHDLTARVRFHRGEQSTSEVVVADDDALSAAFAEEASQCLATGKPTRSHEVTLPYRYLAAAADPPRTDRGVIRFPSRVDSLAGVVSHSAWSDADLDDVDFWSPIERVEAGTYELDPTVAGLVADGDPTRLVLRHLGEA